MMIKALYDLALRENLLLDPDYETHRVDLRLRITPEGAFHSFVQESEGRVVFSSSVPRLPAKRPGGAVKPGYFFDNPSYVLGHDDKHGPKRLETFRSQVRQVAALNPKDPELAAFLRFLEDPRELSRAIASRPEWTGSEWIGTTVLFESDSAAFVHESKLVRRQWAALRQPVSQKKPQQCCQTGVMVEPVDLHPAVKMPGTKGSTLVCHNEPATCLPGVEQGLNAPMSRAIAEGYTTALNWLLERTPERRHRGGISLGDGHVLVFWTKEPHPLEAETLRLFEPHHLAAFPWKTGQVGTDDATPHYGTTTIVPYYGAVLSTNRGRIVVRSWIDTTVESVCRSLDSYVEALQLDGVATPSIRTLLWAAQEESPSTARALLLSALTAAPFPADLLNKTLASIYYTPRGGDAQRKAHMRGLGVRCALLKAILSRLSQGAVEVSVSLDENCVAVPYVLGCALSVMEDQQYVAHERRVGTNIVDNFLRSASTSPACVLGNMLALSHHHAAKILRRGGGQYHEILKLRLLEKLPATPLPVAWSSSDQAHFMLGYYHQREALFRQRELRRAARLAAEQEDN